MNRAITFPNRAKRLPVDEPIIPLSAPCFNGNEWRYLKECLDTGWVSSAGPFVGRFEEAIARTVDSRYAVATVSGTAALHTALQVVGVRPDEEVVVSALTFIAPVNAIRYCGAYPVFMDADASSWQMDPHKLEQFLDEECEMRDGACHNRRTGRRVRAVLPVHLLGLACDMDRIMATARRHRLLVVEDAAEAIGVRYGGRHVGTFGAVGVLSLNGNKTITAGGGGMLLTNESTLADAARYLTTQAKDDGEEHVHKQIGYNYRLTNLQAALGLAQLEQLEALCERKRAIAQRYTQAFVGIDGITPMPMPPRVEPTYWLYTVLLNQLAKAQRRSVIRELRQRKIEARPLWHPIHALPPYGGCQAYRIEQATRLHAQGVSLPCSAGLHAEDQQRCIEAMIECLQQR